MPSFIFRRTESVVYTLEVWADSQQTAEIKASVGPIERVTKKEGVELISTAEPPSKLEFVLSPDQDNTLKDK